MSMGFGFLFKSFLDAIPKQIEASTKVQYFQCNTVASVKQLPYLDFCISGTLLELTPSRVGLIGSKLT